MTDPYNAGELGLSLDDVMNEFDNTYDHTLDYEDNTNLSKEELNNIELPF